MPAPVYHLEAGSTELSALTAITLSEPPKFTWLVSSYRNDVYPLGRVPRDVPLMYTVLLAITPSKSTKIRSPDRLEGNVKCLRYHPIPSGRYPPYPLLGAVAEKGPAMLQSCGTSKVVHDASE